MILAVITWIAERPWVTKMLLGLVLVLTLLSLGLGIAVKLTTAERDSARSGAESLTLKLQMMNQAVRTWKQEAEAQKTRADAAAVQAAAIRVKAAARVDRIAAKTVPVVCLEAVRWGAVTGAEIGADWEIDK